MLERVLITGARAPAALDLARTFHAAGFEVHVADCAPSRMASFSRAVRKMHRFPSPRADFGGFAAGIAKLISDVDPTIVIPTCEEVFYLAALAHKRVFAPDLPTLRRLHSKYLFAREAAALGLAVPETTLVDSAAELKAFLGDAENLVFKPEFSRFGARTLVGPSQDDFKAVRSFGAGAWVAQRRVRGAEVSFYAVSNGSRLVAFSSYSSPWKFRGGAGYAFETLAPAVHKQLLSIAETLAAKLVPRGQFACDVMIDADGTPWLLECNPRATSGVHLFERCAALADAMLGRREGPVLMPDACAKHVGPALWTFGLPTALVQGRTRDWFRRRRQSVDVISAPRDAAPVVGALIDAARLNLIGIRRGISITRASTVDIEWNGEAV
jgi:hypothetical protein